MFNVNSFLDKQKETDIYKKLSQINSTDNFLFYCLDTLETDEKRQKLLNYIKEHDINDSGDVIELVDCIEDGIEPELEEN